jgi:dihydroorotate dehydrogenase electron transfer subunit
MQTVTLPTPYSIRRITPANYRTVTVELAGALSAVPGQFVMAWLPRFDEKPFSLVQADPITLMITAVGPFSRLVHGLQTGDSLWIRGPFGHGFAPPAPTSRIALVGGGYGVAPLLWLAQQSRATVHAMTAIIGARTTNDLLYLDRFAHLAAQGAPLQIVTTTEDGSAGLAGRVTDALTPLLDQGQIDSLYACGPHGMLEALQQLGAARGIPCQLSWEAYMRCAVGICGACEHAGNVLCLDGPVLAYG